MDGSKERPKVTAGLDLGDRYSYLCLIDTQSGEVVEEGRLRTTPEALRRRFVSEPSVRIAIETGTHSPWVSRLLEECGHEVLVANARKLRLIYARAGARTMRSTPRIWLAWQEWMRSSCIRSSTGAKRARPTWQSSAPGKCWWIAARSWSTTSLRSREVLRGAPAQVPGQDLPQEGPRAYPRGAFGGSGSHPGADWLAPRAHRPIQPKARNDLQRALPGNLALAPGRGDRTAHLRAHPGGPLPLRKEPLGRGIPGARARNRPVGREGPPKTHLQGGRPDAQEASSGQRPLRPGTLRLRLRPQAPRREDSRPGRQARKETGGGGRGEEAIRA